MKIKIYHLILFSLTGFYGCKTLHHDYDTTITDEEIYKFMTFAVSDLEISLDEEIQLDPTLLFYQLPDRKIYNISDFCIYRVELDSTELNSSDTIIKLKTGKSRVFKAIDSSFILKQNKRVIQKFKWNPKKFKYPKNRNPRKRWFSLPYFSKDKKTVVIFTRYDQTDSFMAGGSSLYSYKKTDNGWEKRILIMTLN